MQRDELRAFDVPVRLLGQQRQVDAVGEAALRTSIDTVLAFDFNPLCVLMTGSIVSVD
jgi:hypothetical protein